MSNKINPKDILAKFGIDSPVKEFGNGHINDTFCTEDSKYILQRINTSVFKNPDELMENIENVTGFLKNKIIDNGGDPEKETLTVIKTIDGKNYCKLSDDLVFRVYKFIDNTMAVENNVSLKEVYNAGVGFGNFQKMLNDFPVEILHETIKDFHNTPKRVLALKEAIKNDSAGRLKSVINEVEFALNCAKFSSVVVDKISNGEIPLRVTHNDTKINNILFDKETGKAKCVIDLDTVMQGSMLYDFGDALRIAGSTAPEDETDLNIVSFNVDAFKSFAEGYLSETKYILTPTEIELLPFSVKLLTYETGIRFLADYLNGDVYFKVHRENHNLDRARNQFKLVHDIEKKENELKNIIKELIE